MRRRASAFALLVLASSALHAQQEPAPQPALPFFLEGVDLERPSQAAFRDWPPAKVVDRLYPLPWRSAAFQRATLLGQPVMFFMWVPWNRLSQRMLTETLAEPEVLRTINASWLTVVANADRRPDLRERYQTGSWPVVTLLLPSGMPMLSQANPSGQALPITFGHVKPDGLRFALREGRIYYDRWANVLGGVAQVYEKRMADEPPQAATLREESSDQMARWLLGNVDAKNGGFAAAPKYVVGGLAEYAAIRQARLNPALVAPARDGLEKLLASPLWDPVEGGVHRMATLPDWGEIQYEKMLDGNVDLLRDLVFAVRGGDTPAVRDGLAGIVRFLTTQLARPGGGFFNARMAPTKAGETAANDRLVLAGSNVVAGAALLRAAALLGDDAAAKAGRAAIDFVLERTYSPGRGVGHVVEPAPEPYRFLSTQADVAFGLIDAYESTGDARYLAAARDVADFAWNNLRTGDEVAVRDHLAVEPDIGLLALPKWPMPDNVRLARVFLRLYHQGAGESYRARGAAIVGAFARDCTVYRVRGVDPALAVEEFLRSPLIVTVPGNPADPAAAALRRAAIRLAHPWTVVRTAAAGSSGPPLAALAWGSRTVQVEDPAALAAQAEALVREDREDAR